MNKYNSSFLFCLVTSITLIFSACTLEDEPTYYGQAMGEEKKTFSFNASICNANTRTTFDEDFSGLNWQSGDMLGLYTDTGDMNVVSRYREGQPFLASLTANATEVYAYYPYSADTEYDGGTINLPIPQVQRQEKAGILNGRNIPMWAKATLASGNIELEFTPQAAILAFNVYNSSYTAETESVRSIAYTNYFTAPTAELALDLRTGEQDWSVISFPSNVVGYYAHYSTALVGLEQPYQIPRTKPSGKDGYIYMAVNTGTTNFYSSFIVTTDKHVYTFRTDETINHEDVYSIQTINMDLANADNKEDITYYDFPDTNFKQYLLEEFDADNDGRLSSVEGDAVEWIDCSGRQITSLEGIEQFFGQLKVLVCDDNELENLDVSSLRTIARLSCKNNKISKLELGSSTNFSELYCDNNRLESLDVSMCKNLKKLYCSDNELESLDVENNTKLTSLFCNGNELEKLDVSKNISLLLFYCGDNRLTSIDVSNNTGLSVLSCPNNQLANLDITYNYDLMSLTCYDNNLTKLIIAGKTMLTELSCGDNQLTELILGNTPMLSTVLCNNNYLYSLDVSYCAEYMKTVHCNEQHDLGIFTFYKRESQVINNLYIPEYAEIKYKEN